MDPASNITLHVEKERSSKSTGQKFKTKCILGLLKGNRAAKEGNVLKH